MNHHRQRRLGLSWSNRENLQRLHDIEEIRGKYRWGGGKAEESRQGNPCASRFFAGKEILRLATLKDPSLQARSKSKKLRC